MCLPADRSQEVSAAADDEEERMIQEAIARSLQDVSLSSTMRNPLSPDDDADRDLFGSYSTPSASCSVTGGGRRGVDEETAEPTLPPPASRASSSTTNSHKAALNFKAVTQVCLRLLE